VRGVETAIEGDLSQKPAPALFVDLLRQKATGVLTVTLDSTVRRIHFQQGQVRFAQSTVLAESAGSAQVASGVVKQASFDRAVAMARQNKVPLHEALAHSRVLSPEQLKLAVRQQTVESSLGALAMDSGQYRFDPQPQAVADSVPDARTSPVALVVDAAKRFAAPAQSKKWLEARRDSTFTRSQELDRGSMKIGEDTLRVEAETHGEHSQWGQRCHLAGVEFEPEPGKPRVQLTHDHPVVKPDDIGRSQGYAPDGRDPEPGLGLEGAAYDEELAYE